MSRTADLAGLLQACIQDLHAARLVASERLPSVASHAGAELAVLLGELADGYCEEARELAHTGISLDGPANLWMAGIMDDAERDTRSIVPGLLLDIALVGAVRKGVMADYVSLETAIAVARETGRKDAAHLAAQLRDRAAAFDARLRALLEKLG